MPTTCDPYPAKQCHTIWMMRTVLTLIFVKFKVFWPQTWLVTASSTLSHEKASTLRQWE